MLTGGLIMVSTFAQKDFISRDGSVSIFFFYLMFLTRFFSCRSDILLFSAKNYRNISLMAFWSNL